MPDYRSLARHRRIVGLELESVRRFGRQTTRVAALKQEASAGLKKLRRRRGDLRRIAKMLRPYIIYFKYKIVGEKADPPVRQFRIYATNAEEARRLAIGYANYPNIEIVNIKAA